MENPTDQVTRKTLMKLKEDKNAIILCHNYQPLDIQDIADFVGDSLELAIRASEVKSDVILFCGVLFMAETAALLNPKARVLLSHQDAGCPMADMITGEQLRAFKAEHPGAVVICYVNSSVEVKAESDICCTSANAVHVMQSIPPDKEILFVPDQNLGTWAANQTGRNVTVWQGYCNVHHHLITLSNVKHARKDFPDHLLIVHPECTPAVTEAADAVGSTSQIATYTAKHPQVVIGTEIGMIHQLQRKYPDHDIQPLSENAVCVNMKKTTMRDVLLTLKEERNRITIPTGIAQKALRSVQRMLDLG